MAIMEIHLEKSSFSLHSRVQSRNEELGALTLTSQYHPGKTTENRKFSN